MKLEDLRPQAALRGILPAGLVTTVGEQWHGEAALNLIYRGPDGRVAEERE